jgi:hypothetical protein
MNVARSAIAAKATAGTAGTPTIRRLAASFTGKQSGERTITDSS